MAVARRGPVGAVVNALLALDEAQAELRGDVPARVQGVGPGVVAGASHQVRVDRLALPQGVGDEHDGLLVEGEVVDARTGSLDPEVVLVLDVDLAVLLPGDLDVVRRPRQADLPVLLVDDRPVRVHDGVHVARAGMVVVGVDRGGEDGILEGSVLLVDVPHGVGGTGEDDPVHVDVAVVLVVDALLAVGEDLNLADADPLAQVYPPNEQIEDLADPLPRVLPRDAGGDVAVGLGPLGPAPPGVGLVREEGDLSLDEGSEDCRERPQLVH